MEENKILPKRGDILSLCVQVWKDYHLKVVDYETLDLEKYTREFAVSKFPRSLIAPILLKRTEPTETDAANLRIEINRWHTSKRNPNKEDVKVAIMEEQTAIATLKKKGYRVMKKTVAYIDL